MGNPSGALTVAVPGSVNRFCFILPTQLSRCYIGLTDEKAELEDVPRAPESDVQWILDVVNQGLQTNLTSDDVLGAFAGLRPLVQLRSAVETGGSTADLSREHLILNNDGVVTVTGGKLTEYRLMAEQTVDEAVGDPEIRAALAARPTACCTKEISLVGASAGRSPQTSGGIARAHAVASSLPASLVARYGAETHNVLAASVIPDGADSVAGLDITRAEISYAVTHEGATTVGDILDRRTRIGLVGADRAAAEPVAREALGACGL
ncbi:glycerol-3-phosphate dehydrogenase C-terminal domain-containing protein [Corynebacterium qintianiae]|uniref:glycerol-3-phosphate dehydrogenase C-terminal domain-containing protein n=1 Tax=Corynebacterium qintianiae TaxID=2709392 RepID=UPI001F24E2E2|nr:glycerol-3-phosphate dehydrogenase C-terminal domain-containing protein [Corynebacterium qintianiae]